MSTLADMKKHFESFFLGSTESNQGKDAETERRMEHGRVNEINAMATLLSKILPVFHPGMKFREVGCYLIKGSEVPILVSPDGEGVSGNRVKLVFEFKCPTMSKPYHSPVHYQVPMRYLPQVLCEMNGPDGEVDECLFISWTAQSTTVFRVLNDPELWTYVLEQLASTYQHPVYPRKKPSQAATLLEKFKDFQTQKVIFLDEFPSCRALPCGCTRQPVSSPEGLFHQHGSLPVQPKSQPIIPLISEMQQSLKVTKEHINKAAQLLRPLAKDVLVYVLSDLDLSQCSMGLLPRNCLSKQSGPLPCMYIQCSVIGDSILHLSDMMDSFTSWPWSQTVELH